MPIDDGRLRRPDGRDGPATCRWDCRRGPSAPATCSPGWRRPKRWRLMQLLVDAVADWSRSKARWSPMSQSRKRLSQNSGSPPSSFLMMVETLVKASWYS